MELFFDTETSGLPLWKEDYKHEGQPHVIQLGWLMSDGERVYSEGNLLLRPVSTSKIEIHPKAEEVHGISAEMLEFYGVWSDEACKIFAQLVKNCKTVVCHNTSFDKKLMLAQMYRDRVINYLEEKPEFCTMVGTTNLCKIPGKFGKFKWPKLIELYQLLFEETFEGAHDALADVRATARCYYELKRRGEI